MLVVHDGKKKVVWTTDLKVGELLHDLGVKVGAIDRVSPRGSHAIRTNQPIVVQRVVKKRQTVREALDYPVTNRSDSTMYQGESTVITSGVQGSANATYDVDLRRRHG